jgi:hypothetical protein
MTVYAIWEMDPEPIPEPTPEPEPAPTPTSESSSKPAPSPSPTPTPTPAPGSGYGAPPARTQPPRPFGIPEISIPKTEIPDDFIKDHIQYVKGYPNGAFMPDAYISRSETAAIIYRLLKASLEIHRYYEKFPDVARNAWYAESVSYLAENNIILGYPDGELKPGNPITRAEFATIISKFDGLIPDTANDFNDIAGHWAADYIISACEKGWISGYPDGTYRPDNYITRAEVVSSINRVLHRMILDEDITAWAPEYTDLTDKHWAYAAIIEASIKHRYDLKFPEYNSFLEIWPDWIDDGYIIH